MTSVLRLKKREERRVLAGHLWVFANEIDTAATPLKGLEPGCDVTLEGSNGRFLAHASCNPHSLIAARITSRKLGLPFSATLLRNRLTRALQLREFRFDEPWYRWVYGEGDFLPGLVVDRYDSVLMVQITTAGMERWRDEIIDALQSLAPDCAIQLVNDGPARALEHLPLYREWVTGDPRKTLSVRENGLEFEIDSAVSQKTGWFYDHRSSRWQLRDWVRGRRVLDLYCYAGAFGLNAAAAGAAEVLCVDASAPAVAAAERNAGLNGFQDRIEVRQADAVEALRDLYSAGERFDVVVLDPPAFIKRRKDWDAGLQHYALNNRLAMRLLNDTGILLSASCSQALSPADLLQVVRQNLPRKALGLQVLATLQQGPDHPINVAMPETHYLSGIIGRVS